MLYYGPGNKRKIHIRNIDVKTRVLGEHAPPPHQGGLCKCNHADANKLNSNVCTPFFMQLKFKNNFTFFDMSNVGTQSSKSNFYYNLF